MTNSLDNLSVLLITFENFKNYYDIDIERSVFFKKKKKFYLLWKKNLIHMKKFTNTKGKILI